MKGILVILLFFTTVSFSQLVNKNSCSLCSNVSRTVMGKKSSTNSSAIRLGKDTAKMVLIPGGKFLMGNDSGLFKDAYPVHEVELDSFWMDEHEVTNGQYAAFVKATGYVTVAERPLNSKDFPGVPLALLKPGSAVFVPPASKIDLNSANNWWQYVHGASWKQPLGPGSNIEGKENEPVTQVAFQDAVAYANWAGKRLPTEAEWEYAARGNQAFKNYYWGEEVKPQNKWRANIFQGEFPHKNTQEDGFIALAPIKSFPPNAFGLYDMEGNAWEWCADYYRPDYYAKSEKKNPKGPQDSFDPQEPGVVKRVQRGGSFLCSEQYCLRYRAGSRGKGEENSASNNLGFRCVSSAKSHPN